MSQHDMDIANQGFPAFRSDLNNALKALASNNSGDAEPSTTFANQFWYETDTNLLKFRNEDNDAWITLAYFDQTNDEWEVRSAVIQAVDSAGISLKTDDGTTRIDIQDDGDVSIDSGTLFVDATNNRVGVGTSSPSANLEVSDSSVAAVRLTDSGSSAYSQLRADAGTLQLDANAGNAAVTEYISMRIAGSEAMRIDSSGNVGIGTSSPARKFHVEDTGNIPARIATNTSDTKIEIITSSGTQFVQGSGNNLLLGTNNTERVRILSSGGITFNGDTAAANALDDYEEGTWTPGFGGTRALTGGTNSFRYVKVGKQVTVYFSLINATWSGSASGSSLTGLPFTNHGTTRAVGAVQFRNINLNDSTFNFTAVVAENNNYVFFPQQRDNSTWLTLSMADLTAGDYLAFTVTYEVA